MNDDKKDMREELEDRLADQALREKFSSKKPPDLSAKIADRHAATMAAPTSVAVPLAVRKPWRTTARYMAAASLLLAVGGIGFALGRSTNSAEVANLTRVQGIHRDEEIIEPVIEDAYFSEDVSEVGANSNNGVNMGQAMAPVLTEAKAFHAPSSPAAPVTPTGVTRHPSPFPGTHAPHSPGPHPGISGKPYAGTKVTPRIIIQESEDAALEREKIKEPHLKQANEGQRDEQLRAKEDATRHMEAIRRLLAETRKLKNNEDRDDLKPSDHPGEKHPTDKLSDLDDQRLAYTALQEERNRIKQELREKGKELSELLAKGEKSEKLIKDLEEVQVELLDLPVQLPPLGQGEGPEHRGANFDHITENEFLRVKENALSTFSIDVDTAAYSIMRRYLKNENGSSQLPPAGAVRIEEYLNYFSYDYAGPKNDDPFSANVEVAACPWNAAHRLVRVGLKGKDIAIDKRPSSNLVFLLDVSGSMDQEQKLPWVKESMRLLLDRLGENDRVAIVVYAGAAGLVLPSTTADKKTDILAALDKLHAGGSTNGAQGIELAYQTAVEHFIKGGTNRVILCTDGDFNVGTTSNDALHRLIQDKAKSGVFLSVLGFGMDNLQDKTLETLADKGNGNYGYIDSLAESNKIFGQQLTGTLITIAKDVKIQIEFNPAQVAAYRLIGFENRVLAAQDFNDDKKDAGEIGAGHTVTALYEVTPIGVEAPAVAPAIDKLRYQVPSKLTDDAAAGELMTLKLRYKQPDGDKSKLLEFPVKDEGKKFGQASEDFRFASAVAAFGMLLRRSEYSGNATFAAVAEIAEAAKGKDAHGYRAEFLDLVKLTQKVWGNGGR